MHQNLRLLFFLKKSEKYSSGPTRTWGVGGDSHEVFDGGADFVRRANLYMVVHELKTILDDMVELELIRP